MIFAFLLAAGVAGESHAAPPLPPPPAKLTVRTCDAGEHYQFATATCSIELHNAGNRPIRVSKVVPGVDWDKAVSAGTVVPGNGSAYLDVTIDTRNDEGAIRRFFQLETDEPGFPKRGAEVRAFVLSVLDQARPKLDFGVVRIANGDVDATRSLELTSREAPGFRITGIESTPTWIDARVGSDGHSVEARLNRHVPWGLTHNGAAYIKVGLNAAKQQHAWIEVNARVLGAIVPDADPFPLGLMRTVGKHEFLLRITSRLGKDFQTGTPRLRGIKGAATMEQCVPITTGCRLARVSVDNDQRLGKIEGVLEVPLPEFGTTLPVELVGMLLTPETKIHDLDEVLKRSESKASSAARSSEPDLTRALANATKENAPPPPGHGPLLRWSAVHQETSYGYLIYRSESAEGPLVRVNKDVIPVSREGVDASGNYQWRDTSAESGKTYWYEIGVIKQNGVKEPLSTRQRVVAK